MSAAIGAIEKAIKDISDVEVSIRQTVGKLEATIDRVPQQVKADWDTVGSSLDNIRTRIESRCRALRDEISGRVSASRARIHVANPKLSAAAKAEASRLTSLFDATRANLESSVGGALTSFDDTILEMRATTESATKAVQQSARRVGSELTNTVQEPLDRIHAIKVRLEDEKTKRKAELRSLGQSFDAEIASAEKRLVTPLHDVREHVAGARKQAAQSVERAKGVLLPPLEAAASARERAEKTLLDPITKMRATLAAVDRQLTATTDAISDGIDKSIGDGLATLQKILAQVEMILARADEALAAVDMVISRFREGVSPPIEELDQLVRDLETLFREAIQALRSLLTQGTALLDAIPAKGLPKMLVQPAMTAIQSGIDSALPPITTAAETAGAQLQSLAVTLATQVNTVKKQAIAQIDVFVKTTLMQLDAVLPPVREQLTIIRTQMDQIVTQIVTQIGAAKSAAVTAIDDAKARMKSQVEAISTQVTSGVDRGRKELAELLDPVSTQIDDARARLDAEVETAVTRLSTSVDEVSVALQQAVDQITQRMDDADKNFARMIDEMLAPIRAQKATFEKVGSDLESKISTSLDNLRKQNHDAIQALRTRIPQDPEIDAKVEPLRARAKQELDALDRRIANLSAQTPR